MLDLFIVLGATAALFFGLGALFGIYTMKKQNPFKRIRCRMISGSYYFKGGK